MNSKLVKAFASLPGAQAITKKVWKVQNQLMLTGVETSARKLTNNTVVNGPMKGMEFPDLGTSAIHASTTPKLFGMYEQELYPALEELLNKHSYDRVIDIGAADGYYAVGLARRVLGAKVVAFEADPNLQNGLRAVADHNNVLENISIQGFCDPESLTSLGPATRTLLISDCEGGEVDLLKPSILAQLGPCDVIAECHDMFVPNCTETVRSYFTDGYKVDVISSVERTLSDVPPGITDHLNHPIEEIEYAIREHRHYTMNWVVAEHL